MNSEENDAMRALDARLRNALSDLDAPEGFDERLQARLSALAAKRPALDVAAQRAELEREHDRRRAAADRAALVDGTALAIAGAGGLLSAWRFAPELARLYATVEQAAGPSAIGFAAVALAGAALWLLLRQFDVNLATLAGRPWNASTY
ncbi:MAG: hypothetical protein MUC71_03700 [Steroidobacteraceae bacterium]|jgi:hypothetical protein|nr:hypothetical protein [Steroidobacteraceae bacterium]